MQRHLLASWRLAWASAWLTAAALASAQTGIQPSNPPPRIPLVPGLTIVTAIAQPTGDYESIKRVLAVDAQSVLLHYSAQYVATDALGAIEPDGKLTRTEVRRRVLRADLEKSTIYLQQFDGRTPELVAGATAIGTSRQVLRDLKSTGKSDITVYQASIGLGPPNPLDRQPGEIDYRLPGTLERKAPYPAWVGLIVNDRPVMLPAVRATGVLAIVDSDFHFLDDEANPLTLRFDIGKSKLRVIRITYPVSAETSGAAGAGAAPAPTPTLEQGLAQNGKVDTYGIYFDFNSAVLRPESETTLAEIAAVLKKNAAWKLQINGHTDAIGGENFNLDLSRQRAAAVRQALTSRHGVAAARLSTDGQGATRPKAPNNTLEGRALNRRVELVRLAA